MKKLDELVKSVDLIDVFLREQNGICSVIPKTVDPQNFKLEFSMESFIELDAHNKVFLVSASLKVVATEKNTSNIAFEMFSKYGLLYSIDKHASTVSEDTLQKFAQTTGYFNAYPYLREAIQALSTKMGLPPVIAPLLKLPSKQKKTPTKSKKSTSK